MTDHPTPLGRVLVGAMPELFARAVALAAERSAQAQGQTWRWALSGGTTPQAWYRWIVAAGAVTPELRSAAIFTVSDERAVPAGSPESNFGNAARLLLDPLSVPANRRLSWPVELAPAEAVAAYRRELARTDGSAGGFEVCMLGLGEDAHTASLFPGSPLLGGDGGEPFAAVNVPDKGWRFTITPTGLRSCGLIVVMALGAAKAPALRNVFHGPHDPRLYPAQLLRNCADRVVWLVDEAAAAGLTKSA